MDHCSLQTFSLFNIGGDSTSLEGRFGIGFPNSEPCQNLLHLKCGRAIAQRLVIFRPQSSICIEYHKIQIFTSIALRTKVEIVLPRKHSKNINRAVLSPYRWEERLATWIILILFRTGEGQSYVILAVFNITFGQQVIVREPKILRFLYCSLRFPLYSSNLY